MLGPWGAYRLTLLLFNVILKQQICSLDMRLWVGLVMNVKVRRGMRHVKRVVS